MKMILFALLVGLFAAPCDALTVGEVATIAAPFAAQALPYAVVAVLAFVYFRFVKGTAREAKVNAAIEDAFHIVEDLKAKGALPKGADKAVVALEQLDSIVTNQKITLTDAEIANAKLAWSAMHGEQKAATGSAAT